MATPSLDGHANNTKSTSTFATLTLSTTLADDILVIAVGTDSTTSTPPSITTVTSTSGLTWQQRSAVVGLENDQEIWWAHAATALTSEVITVTYAATFDDWVGFAFAVNGCNTAAPWDTNTSLPATLAGTSSGQAAGAVPGVSTDSASALVIYAQASSYPTSAIAPSGFTLLDSASNGGGSYFQYGAVAYEAITSALVSQTITWGAAVGSPYRGFSATVDALVPPAGATLALTGTAASGTPGSLSASAPGAAVLTGVAASGTPGSPTATGPGTPALTGVTVSSALGTLSSSVAGDGTSLTLPVPRLSVSGSGAIPRVQLTLPRPRLTLGGELGARGGAVLRLPVPRLTLLGPDILTLRLPTPRLTGRGVAGAIGTWAAALPRPRFTLHGPNTLTLALPRPRLGYQGAVGATGGVSVRLPVPRLSVTAQVPYTAQAALTLPRPRLSVAGTTGQSGRLAATLRGLALALQGHSGVLGELSLTLPVTDFAAAGYHPAGGGVQLVVPHLQLRITGALAGAAALSTTSNTLVMHTEALSLTTYSNFPFNSFASFNGWVLGAGPDGIFSLGGATDNGAVIQAAARVGATDFATSHLKRVDRVYVGYRTDGDLVLRVFTDEINQRDYRLTATGKSGLHGNHLRIGKGLTARYWQFEVRNLNGADFQLNMIELKPTALRRRVGGGDA